MCSTILAVAVAVAVAVFTGSTMLAVGIEHEMVANV